MAITTIALVAVVMGMSTIAPVMADPPVNGVHDHGVLCAALSQLMDDLEAQGIPVPQIVIDFENNMCS